MSFKTAVFASILSITSLVSTLSASVPAPFLLSLYGWGANVTVNWRLNSTSYTGIEILRKAQGVQEFSAIDTVNGGVSSYGDTTVSFGTKYYYALRAFSLGDTSEMSNIDSIVIEQGTFKRPEIKQTVWERDSSYIKVIFRDSSNCEDSFVVYRYKNFGTSERLMRLPKMATLSGEVTFYDTSISKNYWYSYSIAVCKSADTLISFTKESGKFNPAIEFTFEPETFLPESLPQIKLEQKIGSLPVYWGRWATKSGNTILLLETNAPAQSISIIDVSDPSNPYFRGYKHISDTNLTTRINSSSKVINRDSLLLLCTEDGVLRSYMQKGDTIKNTDSLADSIRFTHFDELLDDSVLLVGASGSFGKIPVLVRNGRLVFQMPFWLMSEGYTPGGPGCISSLAFNKTVLSQWRTYYTGGNSTYYVTILDFSYNIFNPLYSITDSWGGSSSSLSYPVYKLPLKSGPYYLPNNDSARCTFNDLTRRVVYLFKDNQMDVYNYSIVKLDGKLLPYTINASTRKRIAMEGVSLHRNKGSMLVLGRLGPQRSFDLAVDIPIFDCKGRRMHAMPSSGLRGAASSRHLSAGVYFIKPDDAGARLKK